MWRLAKVFTKIDCPIRELPGTGAELTISSAAHSPHFARRHTRRRLGRIHTSLLVLASTLALGVAGTAPASAQYYYYGSPYGYGSRYGILRPPTHRPAKQADKKAAKELSKEARKDSFGEIPKGPLQIFVSIDQQKLHLYSDGVHVADTSVATGVPSLPTPLGVFSVIQKQVFHRSNLYSDAPMPFMQRITWSGVALHEGESIGHRASHGCIRMPRDFAVRLYHLTRLGVPVMIAERELKPVEYADPHLFVHRDKPPEPVAAAPAAAEAAPAPDGGKIVVAAQTPGPAAAVNTGLGLRGGADGLAVAATLADATAHDPAPAEPKADAGTAASSGAATDAPGAAISAPTMPAPAPASPAVPMPPAEPPALVRVAPASKAPIAVFVSRKENKIYVRQDFAPLFQAPVTITDPDRPFGTLVFTALDFTGADRTTLRWNVVVFPAEPPPPPKRKTERELHEEKYGHARRYIEEREKPDLSPPQTPAQALARLAIPQAALDYISQLIVPGSTLIVSDHGLGDETGEGTNFVVVLR
jgi:hypothetical protein